MIESKDGNTICTKIFTSQGEVRVFGNRFCHIEEVKRILNDRQMVKYHEFFNGKTVDTYGPFWWDFLRFCGTIKI